jgi:flagellin
MSTSINTNAISLNAQRNLSFNSSSLATSVQRLSSGLRVNSAKDDAAGIAIAERLTTQTRGSMVAMRNAQDAISLFQTAEGAMSRVNENLQRIRELAVQAANGAIGADDRTNLQTEVTQLQAEVSRVISTARYNDITLLGATAADISFQIGADGTDTLTATTSTFNLDAVATAVGAVTIGTAGDATTAIATLDTQLDLVNTARANAGALQSRFEQIINQLQVYTENTATALGRIMDADFASETANLTRTQILQQAGTAMVAQANQFPQGVLALLR